MLAILASKLCTLAQTQPGVTLRTHGAVCQNLMFNLKFDIEGKVTGKI